jgi:hypothetical protein
MLRHYRSAAALAALTLALVVCLGPSSAVQEQKGTKTAETDAGEQAINQVSTAHNLIGYARREKSPEAMLAAVHILWNTPTAEFKGEIEGGEAVKLPPRKAQLGDLLNEARKMRPDDEHLIALTDRLQKIVEEKPRAVIEEAGKPHFFTRQFSTSFSFTRSFAPQGGSLSVANLPGAGLVKDWRIRIRVYRGNQLVTTRTTTLTFANPGTTVAFGVPQVGTYRFEITNLSGGSPRMSFHVK